MDHLVQQAEAICLRRDCVMIGASVKVVVDRPLGSRHPRHEDIVYPVNYGYIPGIMAPDGEEQDAYILGIHEPMEEFEGRVIAIIHRLDDVEDKWVVAPEGMTFAKEEIMEQVAFQEQYFQTEIAVRRKILVTGGTVFVSRFVANYFAQKGDDVYVLNRNSKPQLPNVTLIEADRGDLGDKLKDYKFDAVLDITTYTRQQAEQLVNALGKFGDYIMVSSSAVYPETNPQPFAEEQSCGPNSVWGDYGTNKLAAEEYLLENVPQAYILRPPYLYGPMQNVYREPFVFQCAEAGREFYLPGDGSMKLQFFHVADLCRFMEILLERHPSQRIYNVGNPDPVSISHWVQLCYDAVGAKLEPIHVEGHPQRRYFCFHDYEYCLDVKKQMALMPEVKPLAEGLKESYAWYRDHAEEITAKPYMEYADTKILRLVQAKPEEAEMATKMQQVAFAELLERYQDHDTNPANEGIERILWKIQNPGSYYYFIMVGQNIVGAIRVVDEKNGTRKRISPLYIMPEFRGKGYAQLAMLEAERIHGANYWELGTILEEKGNCYLYEKMGYHQTDSHTVINEKMTIVGYEKD